ncbi:hypothetical protein LMG33818_001889 [Halomonadaceae bacterium LMG 33818]|uniref:protease inhibitor I42 family protein n=1 Tax=Cernens ardua TaxID=3402176 RepID=UPI003EDC450E
MRILMKAVSLSMALLAGTAITSTAMASTTMKSTAPQTLNAQVGKLAHISLEANPTTGYTWMVKQLPSNLILIDGHYQENQHEEGMVGVGGHYTYTFIGQHVGTAKLQLIYGQSFNKASWKTRTITVHVK